MSESTEVSVSVSPEKLVDKQQHNYGWSWKFGHMLNHLRIIPRAALTFYMLLLWQMTQWFLGLDDPTTQQTAFVSVIVGAGPAFFGLYTKTGTSS